MFDLRLPIGYFFLTVSLILVAYGLICPVETQFAGGKINLNLDWGLVMGLFGLCMAALAHRDKSCSQDRFDD